jgi:putative tryptophan/tyrosine transport system substrate-binding protein
MRRREFIAGIGGGAVWPLVAGAQQNKVWRIGYLHSGFWNSGSDVALFAMFNRELNALGYVEGKNLVIDKRAAETKLDRLPALANELVALHPDLIVAITTPATAAAQRATSTIPIIMLPVTDPVRSGFVKSLAHPGGNITGLVFMGQDFTAKSIELLHSIVPGAKKIAVLMSSNPTHPPLYELASSAAQLIGLSTVPIIAVTTADLDRAFQEMGNANCDALLNLPDAIRLAVVPLAAAAKIPAVYQAIEFVEAGGLASYGPNLLSMWKRAAQYVDKIFKGADPADLPAEQPTTFEFALNLKTAKSLGLSIPEAVVLRADKVIE